MREARSFTLYAIHAIRPKGKVERFKSSRGPRGMNFAT